MSKSAKDQVQQVFPEASVKRVGDSHYMITGLNRCSAYGVTEDEAWAAAVKNANAFAAGPQPMYLTAVSSQSSPTMSGVAEAERMLPEYRYALESALGNEAEQYELLSFPLLMGHTNVGVAYQVKAQRVYLMFSDSDRPEPDFLPAWLLDVARELTLMTRTLVVPDQTTAATSFWSGIKHGPITSYQFLLRDRPSRLSFG